MLTLTHTSRRLSFPTPSHRLSRGLLLFAVNLTHFNEGHISQITLLTGTIRSVSRERVRVAFHGMTGEIEDRATVNVDNGKNVTARGKWFWHTSPQKAWDDMIETVTSHERGVRQQLVTAKKLVAAVKRKSLTGRPSGS